MRNSVRRSTLPAMLAAACFLLYATNRCAAQCDSCDRAADDSAVIATDQDTGEKDCGCNKNEKSSHANACCISEACCDPFQWYCPPAPTMIGGGSLGTPYITTVNFARLVIPNFVSNVATNNSALPQDRAFFTYQYFKDVLGSLDVGADQPDEFQDMSLYTVGLEKTFLNGAVSGELIVPFSWSPDSRFDDATNAFPRMPESEMQLQNIAFGLKAVLRDTGSSLLSAGLRVEAPTADDVQNIPGTFNTVFDNKGWQLTPYLALLCTPNDDLFFQAFVSYRTQVNNDTFIDGDGIGGGPQQFGYTEPDYLNVDAQLGYWLYRSGGRSGITGLRGMVELHYTTTPTGYDPESSTSVFQHIAGGGKHDYLDLTAGLTALIRDNATATVAVSVPLRDGPSQTIPNLRPFDSDRNFDWSLMAQFNYYFGQN